MLFKHNGSNLFCKWEGGYWGWLAHKNLLIEIEKRYYSFYNIILGRRSRSLDDDDEAERRDGHDVDRHEGGDVSSDAERDADRGDFDDDADQQDDNRARRERHRRRRRHEERHRTRSDSPTDERLLRHEMCFEPFLGYEDDYDGPKGILTSHLPNGTSTLAYGKSNL